MSEAARVRVIPPIAEQAKKLRVCAYARVSSDSSDQLHSFAVQMEYYTNHIQQNEEWTFVDIYADEAQSGTRADNRDDFQRLMRDCRAGKIDRILVKSISRFARNTIDTIEAVRELKQLGIAVVFEEQQIDTGTMGSEMLLSMLSAAAQEESLSISKNLKWSYQRRMRSGDYITSSAPLGYYFSNNTLVPDPQEAPVVEFIFNSYLSGKSLQEIAQEMTDLSGHLTPQNKAVWSHTLIQFILKNEKYVGDAMTQKWFTPDTLPLKRKINNGEHSKFYTQNSHPPIISREIFDAVQKLLKQKGMQHKAKKEKQEFPLSKKLECGLCGSTFHRHAYQENIRWYCFRHRKSKGLCPMGIVKEAEIYEAFMSLYSKLNYNRDSILGIMLFQLKELQSKEFAARADATQLHKKIAELVKQNHTLSRLQTKGCVDSAIFIERANANNQEINKLRIQLQNLQAPDELTDIIAKTEDLLGYLSETSPLIFEPTVFKSIVQKITVYEGKLSFRLINGLMLEEKRC